MRTGCMNDGTSTITGALGWAGYTSSVRPWNGMAYLMLHVSGGRERIAKSAYGARPTHASMYSYAARTTSTQRYGAHGSGKRPLLSCPNKRYTAQDAEYTNMTAVAIAMSGTLVSGCAQETDDGNCEQPRTKCEERKHHRDSDRHCRYEQAARQQRAPRQLRRAHMHAHEHGPPVWGNYCSPHARDCYYTFT